MRRLQLPSVAVFPEHWRVGLASSASSFLPSPPSLPSNPSNASATAHSQHALPALWPSGPTVAASASLPTSQSSSYPLNTYRLARLPDRLKQVLPLVLGVVGGSNSAGFQVLNPDEELLSSRLERWLNTRWPVQALGSHSVRNRARHGTQSAFMSFCLDDVVPELESYDLLLVDFAANDGQVEESEMSAEDEQHTVHGNMERLARRVLTASSRTALFFTYFTRASPNTLFYSVKREHDRVALRCGIPTVSLRRTLQGLIDSPILHSWLSQWWNGTRVARRGAA